MTFGVTLRVCYIKLAFVTSAIVVGALFVFSGAGTMHNIVPNVPRYTNTMTYTAFVSTPADVDRNEEVYPQETYVVTRTWGMV
jgi:hypothetical protein